MIYAFRHTPDTGTKVLVELKTAEHMALHNFATIGSKEPFYRRATPEAARDWVKRGGIHETGLYVDGGVVRYAKAMGD